MTILHDTPQNSNFSLSEAPATAAHSNCSATEFPPEWIPTEAPPMADDWLQVDPSLYLNVKGGSPGQKSLGSETKRRASVANFEQDGAEGDTLDRQRTIMLEMPVRPPANGVPSGERSSVVQAMAADPSRNRIEPTAADFMRLAARSAGHRSPAAVSATDAAKRNPRTGNTGVEITNVALDIPAPAVVDWTSWTVPTGGDATNIALDAADWACWLSDGSDIAELDRGSMGYTHGYRLPGSGLVLYNPDRPDMGIHCVLSSSALGIVPHKPIDIIQRVADCEGKFTRLDVAVDTHDVHISTVDEAIKRGDLVSRATNQEKIESYNGDGFTIYIGSRTSDRFVRIYDKQAEQDLPAGVPVTTPAQEDLQEALQEAERVLQERRQAVQAAKAAKADAEQSRKKANLSWLTARIGKDKEALALARQERKAAKQEKREKAAALLEARRLSLAAQEALQEAQEALRDESRRAQGAQEGKGTGIFWTRAEVEFKGKQAQMAASYILQGVDLRSLVFSAVDFRDRAADSNTSRCPRLDWWERWIGAVDRVSFAVKTVEKTVVQVYEWVQRQVAPALSFLDEFFGTNQAWLHEICNDNKDRIPIFRQRMIESTPPPERLEIAKDAQERANRWLCQGAVPA